MKFYAIRHIPTGYFLPERQKDDRGYTHLEPTDPVERPPRLFSTALAVMKARTCWLKGRAVVDYRPSDWDTGAQEQGGISYHPVLGRRREDIGVVPVELAIRPERCAVGVTALGRALEYAVDQDNGWNSLSTPEWFVELAAAQCDLVDKETRDVD